MQASYELDLWGKYHTATAAAQRDLMATEFARETVRTMVEADTARYYFNVLAADVELRLLLDTLKLRDESVALQKDRYQAGVIGEYDLRTAEAERASVAGDIAVARRAVTEFESALAVLLGRSPREVFAPSIARDVEIARLTAVPTLPSGVPSDLLVRRPDIQRAEAQLAAANLRIDVARDDYYPAISLTGNYGTQAGALKNLFTRARSGVGTRRIAIAAADRPQGDRSQRRSADRAPQRSSRQLQAGGAGRVSRRA